MKRVLALILTLTLALTVAAFAEQPTTAKDWLVIAVSGDHGNVNMAESVGNNSSMLTSLCTNYLFDFYYAEDGSIASGICDRSLAESYEYDEDNLGITIKLKEGVLFQNGEELGSDDVILSVGFYRDKTGCDFVDYDNMEAVDAYTVYIPFTRVYRSAMAVLGTMGIFNADYWEECGQDEAIFFHDAPIGTGAWQITEYVTDDYVTLVRNDNYFEGPAILSGITVRFISDASTAFAELETGGVDYIFTPNGTDVQAVKDGNYGDRYSVYEAIKEDALLLGYNGYSEYLSDVNVRKAVSTAINREFIVTIYDGSASEMNTVLSNFPGSMTDYGEDWPYPYDPEAAKSYLEAAGWTDTDGDGLVENADGEEMTLTYLYIGTSAIYATIGEILKNNLADIGITLELAGYEVATYQDMMYNDVYSWDFFEMQMGSIANAMGWNYVPENLMLDDAHIDMFDSYASYNEYISYLNSELDDDAWWAKFREFEDACLEEYMYWYPLCQRLDQSIYTSNLQGFERISWQTWNLTECYFTE